MDRQTILNEINRRKNNSSSFSRLQIEEELEKRKIKTEENSRTPMSYMVDDIDIAPSNERSRAVQEYLGSKEFGRLALEITGAVAGTMAAPAIIPAVAIGRAAMLVRPALQGVVTRMAGAGFGSGVGAGASQTFDPTFDAKDDFIDIATDVSKDILRAGATGAVGEGVGSVINKGIAKVVGRNKKLIDGAEEAVKTIEQQKAKILSNPKSYTAKVKEATVAGQLTPALLQEGQLIDLTENIAEMSLVGGGSIRYAREGAETIAQSGLDDFLKMYEARGGDEAIGTLFQKTLTNNIDDFKAVANAKYGALDKTLSSNQFANNFQVDLIKLKEIAVSELKNLGAKSESASIRNFLQGILDEPNYVTFKKANNLRSDYLEISRSFTMETLGKKKGRLAAIASKEITDALDSASVPPKVKELLKDANSFYREGAEVFNTDLFQKIISSDPDLVYKAIVPSAAVDRPNLVNQTFKIIEKRIKDTREQTFLKNKIRGAFLKNVLTKSQKQNSQYGVEIDGGKLSNFYTNKTKTFEAMFTKNQIKEFEKFQNALMFSQGRLKRKGGLPGAIMIQMKQSGAVMQLLGAGSAAASGMTGVGATILIAPAAMAKAFTNKKVVKALTLGLKYNDNPTLAGKYFLQAMTAMSAEGLITEDELDRIKNDVKNNKN
tara:strand:+ start:195 stop:2180 length:1986 start_codon:yes stop_codon:yes gene_type:complete